MNSVDSAAFSDEVQALTAELHALRQRLDHEIAERRRVEAAWQGSQTLLHLVLDALPEAIQIMTPDYRIVITNRVFDEWAHDFGIETKPLGRSPFDLFPFLPDQVRSEYQQVFATGQQVAANERVAVGAAERITETVKIPLIENGQVTHVITIVRDVTAQKHAEAHALEQERSIVLASFVRDASHEFGNPLSVIKTGLYLAQHVTDPAARQRHLDTISGQVNHLERLVRGQLTMMQLEGDFEFRYENTDLNALVHTAHEGLSTALELRDHTCILDLAPDLPPVGGDQRYLHQAISELLRNAIMFTPPGGVIHIKTTVCGPEAMIEIRDNGIGISADDLPHLFERFFRVDRARAERGAGLGLPIARLIVERHQGRITVESAPGQGSTFCVYLPIRAG